MKFYTHEIKWEYKMSAANIFFIIWLFEEGLRVCNDAVLLDFSVVLREFLFQVAVLRFYKTKQFAVFGIFGEC